MSLKLNNYSPQKCLRLFSEQCTSVSPCAPSAKRSSGTRSAAGASLTTTTTTTAAREEREQREKDGGFIRSGKDRGGKDDAGGKDDTPYKRRPGRDERGGDLIDGDGPFIPVGDRGKGKGKGKDKGDLGPKPPEFDNEKPGRSNCGRC